MSRTLCGADTGLPVAGRLVRQRKLTQVPPNHIELYFNIVKRLPVVYADEVPHHLRHHDGVPQVGLHGCGLFSGLSVLLGLFALEVEPVVFMFDFWIDGWRYFGRSGGVVWP